MGDRKNSITRSFIIFTLPHIQINEDEMGGACGTQCGREELHNPGLWWQNWKEIITWKT